MNSFTGSLRFSGRRTDDRELDAEVESHIAFAIDEYIRGGMTPEEARRQAMIRFGGREAAKELQRDARSLPFLECLAQDLRYALRTMRREPGFTVFAILIVGLGVGASVTVFSVLNTVLVRPLPFHEPERLVGSQTRTPTKDYPARRCRYCRSLPSKNAIIRSRIWRPTSRSTEKATAS